MTNDSGANPLDGKPPAPDQLKDEKAEGENPNASAHFDNDPKWKKRPEQYPATDPAAKKI